MGELSVSILSSDFFNLQETVDCIKKSGARYLHMDIMDGHFVPNISYGSSITKNIAKNAKMPLDIHLMIENPDQYLEDFVFDNTEFIVVHQEASKHLHRTISYIKSKGVKAGVALNPGTSVNNLDTILEYVDLVLIMSVNPGFGGQSFIETSIDKVKKLDAMRRDRGLNFLIEVDGGVNGENIDRLKESGVDLFVVGSAITNRGDVYKASCDFVKLVK